MKKINFKSKPTHCKICVMPITRPDTGFENGICSACKFSLKKKKINWKKRKSEFLTLVKKYSKTKNYSCLIPVSGGKDSTYQVLIAKKYGLTPLCICFETTLPTKEGIHNLECLKSIGVDLIHVKRNPKIFKLLTYKGFKQLGNAQWPLFLGAYCAPINFATKFQIPLVLWGENPQAEYGGQTKDIKKKNLDLNWVLNLGGLNEKKIEDMMDKNIIEKDILLYKYPKNEEIRKLKLNSLFLGYFFEWNKKKIIDEVKKIGWKEKTKPSESTFTKYIGIDCDALEIHQYLKYVKFGYGRATDDASIAVREGVISREEAIKLVYKYDGKIPKLAKKRFMDYLDIDEYEYEIIVDKFTNKNIFETNRNGSLRKDIDGSLVKRKEWLLK